MLELIRGSGQGQCPRQRIAVEVPLDLGHFIIVECPSGAAVYRCGEVVRGTERPMPRRCRDHGEYHRYQEAAARLFPAERNQPCDERDNETHHHHWPEVTSGNVHAVSRASSRKPMSRRWKPSANSIWSTAR